MIRSTTLALLALVGIGCSPAADTLVTGSAHDFTLNATDGSAYPLAAQRGKVLLLVNTASRCGFTGQYEGLQALHTTYAAQGLVVIGVPSNDFLGQEPGTNEEIQQFCSTKFQVTFPLMAKVAVSGKEIAPLYRWLTDGSQHRGAVSWNFNKFLIGKDGAVLARWGSRTKPESDEIKAAIVAALAAPAPAASATAAP